MNSPLQAAIAASMLVVGVPLALLVGTWAGLELRALIVEKHQRRCSTLDCSSRFHRRGW